jgi:hypothetical protein
LWKWNGSKRSDLHPAECSWYFCGRITILEYLTRFKVVLYRLRIHFTFQG